MNVNDAFMQQLLDNDAILADDVQVTLNYLVDNEPFHSVAEMIQLARFSGGLHIKVAFNPAILAAQKSDSISIISANITAMGETITHVNENGSQNVPASDKLVAYEIVYKKDS